MSEGSLPKGSILNAGVGAVASSPSLSQWQRFPGRPPPSVTVITPIGLEVRKSSSTSSPTLTPEVSLTPLLSLTPEVPPPFLDAMVSSAKIDEAISMVESLLQAFPTATTEASAELAPETGCRGGKTTQGVEVQPPSETCRSPLKSKVVGAPFDRPRKSVRARLAPSVPTQAASSTEGKSPKDKEDESHTSTNAPCASTAAGKRRMPRMPRSDGLAGPTTARYRGQPRQSPRDANTMPRQSSPSPPPRSCRRDQQASQQFSGSSSHAKQVSSPRSKMQRRTLDTGLGHSNGSTSQTFRAKASPKVSSRLSPSVAAFSAPAGQGNLSRVAEELDSGSSCGSANQEALATALCSMEDSIRSLCDRRGNGYELGRRYMRGCRSGLRPSSARKGKDCNSREGTSIPPEQQRCQEFSEEAKLFHVQQASLQPESLCGSEDACMDDFSPKVIQEPSRWFSAVLVAEQQTVPIIDIDRLGRPRDCINTVEVSPHAQAGVDMLIGPNFDEVDTRIQIDQAVSGELRRQQDAMYETDQEVGDAPCGLNDDLDQVDTLVQVEVEAGDTLIGYDDSINEDDITLTFQPGVLGLEADLTSGLVIQVHPDSQAQACGVPTGWTMTRINGQSYSVQLLERGMQGESEYDITFTSKATSRLPLFQLLPMQQDAQETVEAENVRSSSDSFTCEPLASSSGHPSTPRVSICELRNRMEKLMAVLSPNTPLEDNGESDAKI